MKEQLSKIYNGIWNDFSIRRNTMGWKDVVESIERKYKSVEVDPDVQFTNQLLFDAISVAPPKIKSQLEIFAKELQINLQTIRSKT